MLVNAGCFYVVLVVKITVCHNEHTKKNWEPTETLFRGDSTFSGGNQLWQGNKISVTGDFSKFIEWTGPPQFSPLVKTLEVIYILINGFHFLANT